MQIAHVSADGGADIGVHDGGRGAFVLAILAQNFVRERNVTAGQFARDDFAREAFVLGVGVGMKEADGDGVDVFASEFGAGALDVFGLSGSRTSPEAYRRSATSMMRWRGTSGCGR